MFSNAVGIDMRKRYAKKCIKVTVNHSQLETRQNNNLINVYLSIASPNKVNIFIAFLPFTTR
jgi:hypothetical protein